MSDKAKLYYIVDMRSPVGNCALFWGKNSSGYVCNLDEAGKYDEEFARRPRRATDVPILCETVEAMRVVHVRADTLEFVDALRASMQQLKKSPP